MRAVNKTYGGREPSKERDRPLPGNATNSPIPARANISTRSKDIATTGAARNTMHSNNSISESGLSAKDEKTVRELDKEIADLRKKM